MTEKLDRESGVREQKRIYLQNVLLFLGSLIRDCSFSSCRCLCNCCKINLGWLLWHRLFPKIFKEFVPIGVLMIYARFEPGLSKLPS